MTTTDHSDHTEVLNEFHDPGTGNVCLGVWKYVGHNTYKLKHTAFLWDANGVWIGYRILRQTVTLAPDGNSFTGTWSNDRTDINGNILVHIDARHRGRACRCRLLKIQLEMARVLRLMEQRSRDVASPLLLSE
jgi:hypothetical protein